MEWCERNSIIINVKTKGFNFIIIYNNFWSSSEYISKHQSLYITCRLNKCPLINTWVSMSMLLYYGVHIQTMFVVRYKQTDFAIVFFNL